MTKLGMILKLGKDCGLSTCGEAILNMKNHYDAFEPDEYNCIIDEYNDLLQKNLISKDVLIDDMKILM